LPDTFTLLQDGKELKFTEKELFSFLFQQLQKKYPTVTELENVEDYVKTIFSLFSDEIVTDSNFKELFTLFFLSGFYYSNFLLKNDVQITKKDTED
jgi:hypothetical protein